MTSVTDETLISTETIDDIGVVEKIKGGVNYEVNLKWFVKTFTSLRTFAIAAIILSFVILFCIVLNILVIWIAMDTPNQNFGSTFYLILYGVFATLVIMALIAAGKDNPTDKKKQIPIYTFTMIAGFFGVFVSIVPGFTFVWLKQGFAWWSCFRVWTGTLAYTGVPVNLWVNNFN